MGLENKKKSKKQLIIEESAVLFSKMGYSATSMNDIANGVGIKAASLYNHISSKQEILNNLLITIAKKFEKSIIDANLANNTAKDKLREIIKLHIEVATENQSITGLILQEWKHLEEPSLSEYRKIRNNYQDIFKNVIEEGMESGELKPRNLNVTLNVILSSLRWIYVSEVYDSTIDVDKTELEHTIMELVMEGVSS